MKFTIAETIEEIPAADWNAVAGTAYPFFRHEFLAALERHQGVGERFGWLPRYLLAFEGSRLAGAVPLYLKDNSYGEFVFDWAWADAYHRNGTAYYPKAVVAVPYTPATAGDPVSARNSSSVNGSAAMSALSASVTGRTAS